ncbi:leucyl aminopeptidase [Glaciecola sp. SC05]|uniref:leucyl aminopeptidase n=1 Tax=Glaciecola sp. SC05 TaxID=1987355 RepID=UPI003527991F
MKISMIKVIALTTLMLFLSGAHATATFSFSETQEATTPTVVVFVSDPQALSSMASTLDTQSNGALTALLSHNKFDAKLGSTLHLQMLAGVQDILVVGVASADALDAATLQNIGGSIAGALKSTTTDVKASIFVENVNSDSDFAAAHIAYGYDLRHYSFDKYKTVKHDGKSTVALISDNASANKDLYEGDLQYLADGVHLTRDIASEPGKSMYPVEFVERVSAMFKGVKNVNIDVLDVADMERLNMGALLGVGQGSIHEPRMLVINYKGGNKSDAPIALAGKGITFDTGGISLKGNENMWQMKSDLAGAAAVAGTLYAVAKRGETVNLVGLMPLAENMPAEDAIRPGDVLNTMQGTSIEIISTDAEGRLVLSDAVYYAQKTFEPKMLLNIATLTGSAARALSDEYAAVITRDFSLSTQMMAIGKKTGEDVWPLPLHPNHYKQIHSDIADIKNSGAGNPGASVAAAVIGTFVADDLPWVHLDIAGVDWLSDSIDTAPKGSQGWGVRFMDQLVRDNK